MKELNESLYYAEVQLLTKYCRNCLDDKMKDKIMMFLFKNTLYDNAIELGFTEDADQYYTELMNLLDMRTCDCSVNDSKSCANGYCELCR